MDTKSYAELVTKEVSETLSRVSPKSGEQLSGMILQAQKILVAGAGRSGLAAKAFAMRLMHMGFDVYVCGETITPNLEPEDLFLVVSGSGTTSSLVCMTQKAKQIGAAVATLTIRPDGEIGQLADLVVEIPAPTPKAATRQDYESIQPMGSLFEQSCLLYLDCMVLKLMEAKQDHSESMFMRHANLE